MPQRRCPAPTDEPCEKLARIKPFKGKQFKLDIEIVKLEVGRSECMTCSKNKRASIQYDMVKRKMRARGWTIFCPSEDNIMGLACTPMWLPLAQRQMYQRIQRNPDESLLVEEVD